MKKFLFLGILFISLSNVSAQTRFGLTAGYLDVTVRSTFEGVSASMNEPGFYLGALADFTVSEAFHIQPGINYGQIEDSGVLFIPVMGKYYIPNSGFSLQAGPQATYLLEDTDEEINAFGLDIKLGAGYDITNNFFVDAYYALGLTNRLSNEFTQVYGDVKSKINSLTVGLGYKF